MRLRSSGVAHFPLKWLGTRWLSFTRHRDPAPLRSRRHLRPPGVLLHPSFSHFISPKRHLTVYVVGEHEHLVDAWAAVSQCFGGTVPPATLLGVNLLGHRGQLVEIDATVIAASPAATHR